MCKEPCARRHGFWKAFRASDGSWKGDHDKTCTQRDMRRGWTRDTMSGRIAPLGMVPRLVVPSGTMVTFLLQCLKLCTGLLNHASPVQPSFSVYFFSSHSFSLTFARFEERCVVDVFLLGLTLALCAWCRRREMLLVFICSHFVADVNGF